jgi:hypothetical protein
MPGKLDEELMHRFAVVGTFDEIVDRMRARCGGLADRAEFSIPVVTPEDEERLADLVRVLRTL